MLFWNGCITKNMRDDLGMRDTENTKNTEDTGNRYHPEKNRRMSANILTMKDTTRKRANAHWNEILNDEEFTPLADL